MALMLVGCATNPPVLPPIAEPPPQSRPIRILPDFDVDIRDWTPTPVVEQLGHSYYGNGEYSVEGVTYRVWPTVASYVEEGFAVYRDERFDHKETVNKETFDSSRLMAAHRHLRIPCYVRVTNLDNRRSAIVRVNDRGPFRVDALIDLSLSAAIELGFGASETAPVRIELLTDSRRLLVETDAVYGRAQAESILNLTSALAYVDGRIVSHARKNWFRVRIGPFSQPEDALRVKDWLNEYRDVNSSVLEE